MLKKLIGSFLLAAMVAPVVFLTGCSAKDPADSTLPWNRPADWQDRPPGMGFY